MFDRPYDEMKELATTLTDQAILLRQFVKRVAGTDSFWAEEAADVLRQVDAL